jgi:hypothetical protein
MFGGVASLICVDDAKSSIKDAGNATVILTTNDTHSIGRVDGFICLISLGGRSSRKDLQSQYLL